MQERKSNYKIICLFYLATESVSEVSSNVKHGEHYQEAVSYRKYLKNKILQYYQMYFFFLKQTVHRLKILWIRSLKKRTLKGNVTEVMILYIERDLILSFDPIRKVCAKIENPAFYHICHFHHIRGRPLIISGVWCKMQKKKFVRTLRRKKCIQEGL